MKKPNKQTDKPNEKPREMISTNKKLWKKPNEPKTDKTPNDTSTQHRNSKLNETTRNEHPQQEP